MTNYARDFRDRENARLNRLEEKPCQHAYDVRLLVSVVPEGKPCVHCGEPYTSKPRRDS